jgi:hypothetical protein
MKRCVTCGEEKSFGEFYKRPDSPDGFRNDCKECRKALSNRIYLRDPEQQKAQRRDYYRRQKSLDPEYCVKKYWADVERSRELNRLYYQRDRKKRIEKSVAYAKANSAKANATKKKYKLAKKKACPPWVYSSRELCGQIMYFYEEAQRLASETGVVYHVDHIIPLQGETVCGLHVPWNLQVLTASENCSKQNRLAEESV